MSRSGYDDSCDGWELIRWRGAVARAVRGRRGQVFLRELLGALDALPDKRLIKDQFEAGGEVCALGALGRLRGLDMSGIDIEDREEVASVFGISGAMAAELMYWNDDRYWSATPEERWTIMRRLVEEALLPTPQKQEQRP